MTASDTKAFSANKILARLPSHELEALALHADVISVDRARPLIEPHKPIREAYFPISCLASLVTVLEDGSTVESGAVGREGMVGVPVILGAGTTPMQTLVQVPGETVRVPAAHLKEVFERGAVLKEILNRYVHTLFFIASQSAACNRRHRVEARLARWLLTSADGIASEEVAITHDFLATMLGVRRSSVTETALKLQEEGLIDYRRSAVTILDRKRLEATACECYGAIRAEYLRMFG